MFASRKPYSVAFIRVALGGAYERSTNHAAQEPEGDTSEEAATGASSYLEEPDVGKADWKLVVCAAQLDRVGGYGEKAPFDPRINWRSEIHTNWLACPE